MGDAAVDETVAAVIRQAEELESSGCVRNAIDLLSMANRRARHADAEGALVRIRCAGGSTSSGAGTAGGADAEPRRPERFEGPACGPQPAFGRVLLTLTAIGLIAHGLFSFADERYRQL